MEWLYWITLFVGTVVLATGCLILAQTRRQERVVVVVHEARTGTGTQRR